jgi:cyanate permease
MSTAFRGWWIVAVAFLAQVAAIGFSMATYPLFVTSVTAEFGISLTTFNLGGTILVAGMAVAGLAIGPLLDHRSIRSVMVGGALLLAVSLALMSRATEVWQLGVLLGVGVAPAVAMLGPLAATTVVAKWFERLRGRAVGIASIGPTAGGLLIAYPAGVLIQSSGWRTALLWFAGGALLMVPVVWGVIRNRPEDIGQIVDGGKSAGAEPGSAGPAPVWSASAILTSQRFWPLALALGILFGFISGWTFNLGKFAADLGHDTERASMLLVAGAALGIPGTFYLGWLADRRDGRALLWIAIALQMVAFAVLRMEPGFGLLLAASAVIGCGAGGILPVYAALLGRAFGPAAFGIAMGIGGMVQLPFMAVAPPLIGQLRDRSGDFDSALLLVIAVYALAAGLLVALQRPRLAAEPVVARAG